METLPPNLLAFLGAPHRKAARSQIRHGDQSHTKSFETSKS